LREANRGRPFRKAIEATLQQDKFHWRGGLPLGAASPALAGLGVLALSAAAFLFSLGPAIRNAVGPGGSPPTAAVGFAPADRPAAAPAEVTPVPEQPAREASPLSGAPEQSLDDLLSGLWETPGSTGVLSEAGGDLGDLSRAVDQGAAALKELLAQIQRRLDESSGSMTEEERQRLSELVQSVPDTALRKALESLLNQTEDEGTRQALEKARQLAAQSGNQESAAAPEDASPTSPSSDEDETTRGVPTPPSQGAVGAATPEEVAEGNGQPSVGGQVGSAHEGPGEDWSSAGGTEAAPPSSGAEADRAPGPSASFLPADVAGIVGPDGDVRQFLTKGVPVEPPPEPTEAGADLRVDYENLRALLDSRSLPSGTQDSVRRYFQFVTQGGP